MEDRLNYNTVIAKTSRGGKNPSNKKNLVPRQERRKKGNEEQMGEGRLGGWSEQMGLGRLGDWSGKGKDVSDFRGGKLASI